MDSSVVAPSGSRGIPSLLRDASAPDFTTPPAFIDCLPIAICACDSEGCILWFNRRAVDLWGRQPAVGEALCGSLAFDGHEVAPSEAPIAGVLANAIPVHAREAVLLRPDGSRRWVTLHIDPVKDQGGEVIGAIHCFHDITEWRAAQDALREQDRRLAVTYEQATVAIVEVDAEGRRLRVNEMACSLTGRSREELLGRSFLDYFDPHERELEREKFRSLVAGATDCYVTERRVSRRDGREVWVSIRCSSVRDEAGRFLYAVRIFDDITEAKIATDALAESEQRLSATYEHAGTAISEVDAEGRLLRVNEATCAITGYSREELIGRTIFEVTHPDDDDRDRFQRQLREPARRYSLEKRIIRKDGRAVWVSVTSSAACDAQGRFRYGIRVMQDISERREAERLRRDSERQLRDLIEALPAAVYTTDAQGRITYYNQAAVELSGREPQLGSDQWCVTWKLYRPDGTPLPHEQCPMAVALKEGRAIRNMEAVAERPDGTRVPFIPYPTPLRNEAGEIVGAVNMLIDITERRQAETQQRMLLDELNHRVKNNMQMLHALLSGAQRETPIPEAKAVLADAGRRVAAMAAAQQTLYDARSPMSFDAQQFLEAVCESAQQSFPNDIHIDFESSSGQLSNDTAIPLALILNELLTNSVKHAVNGRQQGIVRVALKRLPTMWELSVEDDGPGFELPELHRRSSGIGLVLGLTRQLGGSFEVQRMPCRCIVRLQQ
jgi:PAS domain S-box-containing protein